MKCKITLKEYLDYRREQALRDWAEIPQRKGDTDDTKTFEGNPDGHNPLNHDLTISSARHLARVQIDTLREIATDCVQQGVRTEVSPALIRGDWEDRDHDGTLVVLHYVTEAFEAMTDDELMGR